MILQIFKGLKIGFKIVSVLAIGFAIYSIFGYFFRGSTIKAQKQKIVAQDTLITAQRDTIRKQREISSEVDSKYSGAIKRRDAKVKAATGLISRQTTEEDRAYILKVAAPTVPDSKTGTVSFSPEQTKRIADSLATYKEYKESSEAAEKKVAKLETKQEYVQVLLDSELTDLIEHKPILNIGYNKKLKKVRDRVRKIWATPLD